MKNLETIVIIPARGGSKRLPGKNLMKLGGISLLRHSILYGKRCKEIDAIIVSTDDDAIAQEAKDAGATVIKRPEHLSTDTSTSVSAMQHVLEQPDYSEVKTVVLLQPTNPLRPESLLGDGLELFRESGKSSLVTFSSLDKKFGTIQNHQFAPKNYKPGQRSQDLEPLYFENGLLYITRAEEVRKGKILTEDHYAMIVNHPFARIDIDTKEDFDYAQYLWDQYLNV